MDQVVSSFPSLNMSGCIPGYLSDCILILLTSTLKMEVECSSEMLVSSYRTMWCHKPEDYKLTNVFLLYKVRKVFHIMTLNKPKFDSGGN
jgi:hypothetical protein